MITVLESGKIVSGPKLYKGYISCVSYSVFSTLADGPFPHPLHTTPFTTQLTGTYHVSPIQYSQRSLMAPFPTLFTPPPSPLNLRLTPPHTIPHYHLSPFLHPSSDHSHLPLLRPLPIPLAPSPPRPLAPSPPRPLAPSPLPHTTHNSSLLPHTAPLSVAGTRNNVLICAVSLPVHKTVLQLDRLAKFMKEQFM